MATQNHGSKAAGLRLPGYRPFAMRTLSGDEAWKRSFLGC